MSSMILRQQDEISALESIFNDEEIIISAEHGPSAGQFCAFVELPTDLKLVHSVNIDADNETMPSVSYLPPLVLHFSLPEDYPGNPKSPPTFTLTCQWLDREQLSKLCQHLDCLWEENLEQDSQQGTEILFIWAQFLKNESFAFLKLDLLSNLLDVSSVEEVYNLRSNRSKPAVNSIVPNCSEVAAANTIHDEESRPTPIATSHSNTNDATDCCVSPSDPRSEGRPTANDRKATNRGLDCRAVLDLSPKLSLVECLIEYNEDQLKSAFNRQFHTCNICIENKLGSQCVVFLPCNHVFCKECTSSYFSINIGDGKIQNITCPGGNCDSEAQFNQIKDLICPELFAKYDKLLLDATLNSLGDIVNCPRPDCQYAVTRDEDEKLANCFRCRYAFCVECRMGYHGVEPCRMKLAEEQRLLEEYSKGTAEQRSLLEKRYSRRRLEVLVENFQTKEWISDNSKNCPHCNAAIQKAFGCNKMTCWRCSTHFCWICCTRLDPRFPYLHFELTTSKCYRLLFQGIDTNEAGINDHVLDELAEEDELARLAFEDEGLLEELIEEDELAQLDIVAQPQ